MVENKNRFFLFLFSIPGTLSERIQGEMLKIRGKCMMLLTFLKKKHKLTNENNN